MIRVYGARDSTEAEFVKGLLAAEEISAVIQGDLLQGVLGAVPAIPETLPSVWVNEADADRAMAIVAELNRGGPAATGAGPSWTCPKCGQILKGQFTTCWKCGTDRPAAITGEKS